MKKTEQRAQEKAFLEKCHNTRNRINHAAKLIRGMSIEARRNRSDLWSKLYNLTISTPHGDLLGKDVIKALRKHLADAQKNRCCYCCKLMPNIGYARPIDHILNRKLWPQFSLFYWNLALACYDCNSRKGVKPWSSLPTHFRSYPKGEDFSSHFHPRYHLYDEHIKYSHIENNEISITIYLGLTPQGRRLCVDLLQESGRLDALKKNNPAIANAITVLQNFSERNDAASLQSLANFIDSVTESILQKAKPINKQ